MVDVVSTRPKDSIQIYVHVCMYVRYNPSEKTLSNVKRQPGKVFGINIADYIR